MTSYWATEERKGVLIIGDGGGLIYLDSGPEFEAAVAAKPLPPRDMSDVPALPNPAPSPEQTARAELAAALGLTDAQLSAIIAAAT